VFSILILFILNCVKRSVSMENRAFIVRDLRIMGLTMSYRFLITDAVKQIFWGSRHKCRKTRNHVIGIERVATDMFGETFCFYSCQLRQKSPH
jgi:hypothetical protein